MTKTFHDDEDGADSWDIYAVIHHSPEIQALVLDIDVSIPGELEDLAHAVLPEIGVDPQTWPEWSEALQEAAMTWVANHSREDDDD